MKERDILNDEECLVTVIMPARNAGRTIERSLLSAINQANVKINIIVVNDSSDDSTESIVLNLKRRYGGIELYNVSFGSSSLSRNFAIEKTLTEYVAFLDADDIWREDKISLQLSHVLKNKNCDVVFGSVITFNCSNFKYKKDIVCKDLNQTDLLSGNKVALSTVLMRTKVVQDSGGFKSGRAEDYRMWFHLISKHKFCHVPEALTLYEWSDNQQNNLTIIDRANQLAIFFSDQYQSSKISYDDYLASLANVYYSAGASISIFGTKKRLEYLKLFFEAFRYSPSLLLFFKSFLHLILPRSVKTKLFFMSWKDFDNADVLELLNK